MRQSFLKMNLNVKLGGGGSLYTFLFIILYSSLPLFAQTTYTDTDITSSVYTSGNNIIINTTGTNVYGIAADYIISGTGTVTKTGTGQFNILSTSTYTGGTIISEGTLHLQGDGLLFINNVNTKKFTIEENGTLEFHVNDAEGAAAHTPNFAYGDVTGTGTIMLTGQGHLSTVDVGSMFYLTASTLYDADGATNFTGKFIIDGARLQVQRNGNFGPTTTEITVRDTGQLFVGNRGGSASANITANVIISGSGITEPMNASNDMQLGAIRLQNGTINGTITLAGDASIGTYGGSTAGTVNSTINLNSYKLTITPNTNYASSSMKDTVVNGIISGTGSVAVDGKKTSGFTNVTTLTAQNTYSGGTEVMSGILRISSNANLGDESGELKFSNSSAGSTTYRPTLNTTADINLSGRSISFTDNFTLDVDPNTTLTMGNITGTTGRTLTKSDSGRLNINGTISAGHISVTEGTFSPGETIGTTILSGGNVTVGATSTLLLDIGKVSGTFNVDYLQASGSITMLAANEEAFINYFKFSWDGSPGILGETYTLLSASGGIFSPSRTSITNISQATWEAILRNAGMNPDNWEVVTDTNTIKLRYLGGIIETPEPSTYFLLLFAGACLMVYRRMKKNPS
ncbi:MAG: PEP-CTERM sorting domain-containing protein [Planctomycetia bacterium]|nr:PEP-CTERM sorting domain-containing protein [Planctomycetia bacterium]